MRDLRLRLSRTKPLLVFAGVGVACNGLLGNDPRELARNQSDAARGGDRADAGAAGARDGGSAGEASGGDSGNGNSGSGRAGAGGGAGLAGDAGEAGSAGIGGEAGACAAAECTPGTTRSDPEPCGDCMLGMHERTAVCSTGCRWEWSNWSTCVEAATCHPGTTRPLTANCPCGGTKSQSETCDTSCTWGAPTDTSSCADLDCCTSVKFCDTPDDLAGVPASRGTWCVQETAACTHAEVDTDCASSVAQISCTLTADVYIQYL
jgi:hypothetical protein